MIMAGSAIGSVLGKYWVRRLDWRQAARIALLGTVAGNALSIVLHERLAFVALQFIAGLFAGSLYALTLTISRMAMNLTVTSVSSSLRRSPFRRSASSPDLRCCI